MSWDTIESDPGVLSEMLEQLGVRGVEVTELWSLDDESISALGPCFGLFFLFKWESGKGGYGGAATSLADEVFFAKQTINNACCTNALINVLCNHADELELGPAVSDYRVFSSTLPPELRGDLLAQSDVIRTTHNSFARPEPFEVEERRARKSDEVFHFIAYTQAGGAVWELDGLKPGPVRVGAVPAAAAGGAAAASAGAWTAVAVPEISRRIEEYASSEIRFNLLALVRDKRAVLAEQLQRTVARAEATFAVAESFEPGALAGVGPDPVALAASFEKEIPEFAAAAAAPEPSGDAPAAGAAGGAGVGAGGMAVDGGAPFEPASTLDELRVQYAGLLAEGERLRSEYAAEKEKRDRWRVENARRRHNFVPFLMTLLGELAKHDALMPLVESGRKKATEAQARMRAQAKAAKEAAAGAATAEGKA